MHHKSVAVTDVLAWYEHGETTREIGARYGVSPQTVSNILRSAGRDRRGTGGRGESDEVYRGGWERRGLILHPVPGKGTP